MGFKEKVEVVEEVENILTQSYNTRNCMENAVSSVSKIKEAINNLINNNINSKEELIEQQIHLSYCIYLIIYNYI